VGEQVQQLAARINQVGVMSNEAVRSPVLSELYQQYLVDQDTAAFVHRTTARYSVATLARLAAIGERLVRRAAVLALGYVADYESNATLGRALNDPDRGVRLLAENGIRALWCRVGDSGQRQRLARLMTLNNGQQAITALREATSLAREVPWLAEAWNQRAIAHFALNRYEESIRDCRQALEINPYHFGAAAGMGQCYLKIGNQPAALESFRRALGLNPELEGIRATVQQLERTLKRKK
jgi:tetratricopeptide (TPR) repeat protein